MGTHRRNASIAQRVMVVVSDLDYLVKRLEQFATGDDQTGETLLSESRELHGLADHLHLLSIETEATEGDSV